MVGDLMPVSSHATRHGVGVTALLAGRPKSAARAMIQRMQVRP